MSIETKSLFRAHCLSRIAKLQAKILDPDWGMDDNKEIGLLMHTQVALTEILDDLGVKCYVIDDLETAGQMDRPS
jgi:hypothetical protein